MLNLLTNIGKLNLQTFNVGGHFMYMYYILGFQMKGEMSIAVQNLKNITACCLQVLTLSFSSINTLYLYFQQHFSLFKTFWYFVCNVNEIYYSAVCVNTFHAVLY